MLFPTPPRRPRSESIVPMINVVFLLLIFFLMTAQIAPPEPFSVSPPEAITGTPAEGTLTLHLSADGVPGFGPAQGEPAMTALATALTQRCAAPCDPSDIELTLRADATTPAAVLTRLMPRLTALGVVRINLITVMP